MVVQGWPYCTPWSRKDEWVVVDSTDRKKGQTTSKPADLKTGDLPAAAAAADESNDGKWRVVPRSGTFWPSGPNDSNE